MDFLGSLDFLHTFYGLLPFLVLFYEGACRDGCQLKLFWAAVRNRKSCLPHKLSSICICWLWEIEAFSFRFKILPTQQCLIPQLTNDCVSDKQTSFEFNQLRSAFQQNTHILAISIFDQFDYRVFPILLIIKFSSQLMHQRRCEEIPAHFIPKHHSKYLMRKTILNSKFQWLAKYVSDEDQLNKTNCLSKFINIQPKETFNAKDKKKAPVKNKENATHFFEEKRQSCPKQKSHLSNTFSSNLSRKSRTRVQTDPEQSFLEEKDKPRNKSLLMNRTYLRKTPSFFDKESRKTYSEKIKSKQSSHTNIFRRNYQIQNYSLTPWGMQKQNVQSCEFIPDL